MEIKEMIKKIHNIDKDVMKEYSEVRKLTSEVLKKISIETETTSDICLNTGVAVMIGNEEYPYYLCYKGGVFCLMQDQDPGYEGPYGHEYTRVSPEEIDGENLVEIVNRFPQCFEGIVEELKEEHEENRNAIDLLKKILRVIK